MRLEWARSGERVAGLGGVALLVSLFLPWYATFARKIESDSGHFSIGSTGVPDALQKLGVEQPVAKPFTAWQQLAVLDIVLLLVALGVIGLVIATVARRSPAPTAGGSALLTALGVVAALAVLYRIVDQPGDDRLLDLRVGALLGLLASAAIAYGGWRAMRDEGPSRVVEPPVANRT